MTAQATESLHYEGEGLSLCGEPLAGYFALLGESPPFAAPHTALWRGYIGGWEILDNRLYLTELSGYSTSGDEIDLQQIFPDFPERVFAHWVNGRFRATRGERLQYVHAGFASVYEQDLFFEFDEGILLSVEVRDNRTSPNQSVGTAPPVLTSAKSWRHV